MRNVLLALLALAVALPIQVNAQEDPLLQELQKLLREQGGRRRLQRDPKFRQSKSQWPAYERTINESIRTQDEALAGPREGVERSRMLFETRARTGDDPVNLYLHGRIQGQTGNLEEAYRSFRRAIEQDLYFYWAWDGLGVYHSIREDWVEAAECFERALQIREDFVKAKEGLVLCFVENGRFASAVTQLKEILLHPDASPHSELEFKTRKQLADVYRLQGEYARAIDELSTLINRGDRDPQLYAMRAWSLARLDRYADAAQDGERLVQIEPEDHRPRLQLASYYFKLGRNADAADTLEKALEVAGDRLDEGAREGILSDIERFRQLPARQKPNNKRRTPSDLIEILLEDKDPELRRQAIFALSTMPRAMPDEDLFKRVVRAFARAVQDKDPIIRAKALEQVCYRLPRGEPRVFNIISVLLQTDPDPRVRAQAVAQSVHYPEREIVPHLILALRAEGDPYVVVQLNDVLNSKTLAWVKRVLPPADELEIGDISAVREAWNTWYGRNRDVYRKYEPEEFKKR